MLGPPSACSDPTILSPRTPPARAPAISASSDASTSVVKTLEPQLSAALLLPQLAEALAAMPPLPTDPSSSMQLPTAPDSSGNCAICLEAGEAMICLDCGHEFHRACLEAQVASGCMTRPRLTFGFLRCALCRTPMRQGVIDGLEPHLELQSRVQSVCLARATEDGTIDGLDTMATEAANEAALQAMAAYHCARCDAVFCAGKAECAGGADPDPTTLLCQDCAWRDAKSDHKCRVHGASKAVYKCDCCCSVATFDCSGNHYCDWCHSHTSDGGIGRPQCRGRVCDRCPLSLPHPPNQPRNHSVKKPGFVIGCTACLGIDHMCEMQVSSEAVRQF